MQVDKLASSDAVVPFKIHGDCRKIHPFHPSELDPFLGNLTCSIFEMREQGLPHTLRKEAARLSQVFKNKSTKAKISSVNCFVKNWPLSPCFDTCRTKGSQGDRGRFSSFNDFDETEGVGNESR